MEKIIKIITFIPWIIYFIHIMIYRINVLEEKDCNKEKYFKYLNKNFFNSINLKELFLFCIFIIFMQYEKTIVLEILFPATYLYLIIDYIHAFKDKCKKIQNKWLIIETIILSLGIIVFFIFSNHLYTTYSLMYIVSILSAFLIVLFQLIYSFVKNKKL